MKFLFDFLPVLLFFITYKLVDIYWATGVSVAIALVQTIGIYAFTRRVERMQLATLAILTVLGGATILLHNERFIMWKPTMVHWLFALVFLGSQFIGKKNLAQRLLEKALAPPPHLWVGINLAWVLFFIFLGALNLWVAYAFSENTWVNFKLFGLLGFMIFFVLAQAFALRQYIVADADEEEK